AGAAAAGEVAVLRAHRDGLSRSGSAGPGVDAGAATWIDQFGAGLLEDFNIAFLSRVLLDLLRTKLQVEVHTGSDPQAAGQCVLQNSRVHVHVGHLAAGARASVSCVDAHFFAEFVDGNAVARITGQRDYGRNLIKLDLK